MGFGYQQGTNQIGFSRVSDQNLNYNSYPSYSSTPLSSSYYWTADSLIDSSAKFNVSKKMSTTRDNDSLRSHTLEIMVDLIASASTVEFTLVANADVIYNY